MRTLSRPMFNMGGPIKQGIMHGIREPYRGGQLVQPGPGRSGYSGAAINAAKWLATLAGKTFGKVGQSYNLGKIGIGSGPKVPSVIKPPGTGWTTVPRSSVGKELMKIPPKSWGARISEKWKAMPSWFKSSVERDPTVQIGKKIYEGRGLIGKPIKWAGKQLATPTGALGLMYVGGRWLTSDGTPATDDQIKQHKDQHGPFDHTDKKKTKKAQDAFAEAQRDTRVKKYLDMMGYDQSRHDAVSKALIDASKIISDRGTLEKKNITRDLINPIIQATSKRFEKPAQIREAVGLMAVKAAIQKDLEDPSIKALRMKQLEKLTGGFEKDLGELLLSRKDKVNKSTLEKYARIKANEYGLPFTVVDETTVIGKEPGVYMVEDKIFRVDENGQATQVV